MSKTLDNTKIKLSTLWIVVMINMIFADILGFMIEFVKGGTIPAIENIEQMMLIAAIVTQIPILMIFGARFLKYKINRIFNIIAAILTTIYVIGGGELAPHYIFIAAIEIICMLFIIKIAWQWKA